MQVISLVLSVLVQYWRIGLLIVLSLAVSFALRSRPLVLVGITVTAWTVVPGVASEVLTGPLAGSVAFAAPTFFVMSALFVQVLANPRDLAEEIGRRFGVYLTMGLVVVVAILVTRTSTDRGGVVLVVDQILAPIVLFLLVGAALGAGRGSLTLLRDWIVVLAALEAAFVLVQYTTQSAVLFERYYRTFYWFNPATYTRWFGTTDSPLVLSLLLGVAVPLLAGLRLAWLKGLLVVLMGAGVLVTQSRTGLAVFALGAVYLVLASRARSGSKVLALAVMACGAALAAGTSLASGVQERLVNDTGSTLARATARDVFFSEWKSYLFSGGGITAGFHVTKSAGLSTSLESSILMYAAGIGIVFSLLYFGAQAIIVLKSFNRSALTGVQLAGLVVLVVPQTYSGLATESLAGPLLWLVMAMAAGQLRGTSPTIPALVVQSPTKTEPEDGAPIALLPEQSGNSGEPTDPAAVALKPVPASR